MPRLSTARLREVARSHGHKTPYAVAKNTGISVSSAYRILNDETQPDLNSALRLAVAYGLDLRDYLDEDDEPAEDGEPVGAVA